jgi:stage II sporulation protein D
VSTKNPSVRIGMIQSAQEIRFSCEVPFHFVALDGTMTGTGRANEWYTVSKSDNVPADIRWGVRLAIAEEERDALAIVEKLKTRGLAASLWHPGLSLALQNTIMDNHEYWIVIGPFADQNQAREFARIYEPVGEAVVVKEIVRPSHGVCHCGDLTFTDGVRIVPQNDQGCILLADVTVGIEFHWQHQRTQRLPGILEVRFNTQGQLLAINELDIEEYLISVNSSEMTAENPMELLKAQTIAARSTILATMGKHHYDEPFHLCADDHCQCYHGKGNVTSASVQATRETEGENLMYNQRVCDARYAKICGGVMEDYPYVWDHRTVPYLVAGVDGQAHLSTALRDEEQARHYIDSEPDVYCNTKLYDIPTKLPYNTRELFRWKVSYDREQVEALIKKKLGDDFGELVDLLPGERGNSGRLIWMDVVGSKKTIRVGKELAIRRILSESHLYSACFYIERERNTAGQVAKFHLVGAGWGHGVGLCQVGATVMAQLGFDYRQILQHYYKNSKLQKIY